MKSLILGGILALGIAGTAQAQCVGYGAYRTCSDSSGNNYSIQKFGNTTMMNGNNYQTGSTWNQTSQRIGNTTITNGRAANGNTWNSTTQQIGNTTFINGRDSNGNTFRKTCNQFGCF